MAEGTRLLTLLQISDLHFAAIDPATGDPVQNAAAIALWANSSRFDGILGHHRRGLQHLHRFYWDLVAKGEEPRLLVTGDVTSFGHGDQFDSANDYLVSQVDLNPPQCNYVGLHVNDWRDYAIPGNHDTFPGLPVIVGPSTAAFGAYFPQLPLVCPPIPLPTGQTVIIAGVNSDADVSAWGKKRLLARGSFCSQLGALIQVLNPLTAEEIRVLLVHHSWHHQGFSLRMDTGSRQALAELLVDENFKVILTGHTHQGVMEIFEPRLDSTHQVLEARSGTTVQIDSVPLNWRTLFGRRPKKNLPKNTLIVHRLYDTGSQIVWHCVGYVRTRSGFCKIQAKTAERSLAVWP